MGKRYVGVPIDLGSSRSRYLLGISVQVFIVKRTSDFVCYAVESP